MNDAFGVCGVESVGDINRNVEEPIEFHALAADEVLSVWPSRNSMAMKALSFCSPMS